MKKILSLPLLFLLYCILIIRFAYSQTVPVFLPGEILEFSDGTALMPTGGNIISVPCVVDWNGDSKKDILGGYFYNGWVYQYINVGTNSQPVFIHGNETLLQANGNVISVAYG